MTIDVLGIATILTVLMFSSILILYNSRQAEALAESRDVLDKWYMMMVKDRREGKRESIKIEDANEWLTEKSNVLVTGVHRTFENPMLVDLMTDQAGTRVIVSPHAPHKLRTMLRPIEKAARKNKFVESVFPRTLLNVRTFSQSVDDDSEWFDIEANQVGQNLKCDWGEVNTLWFYLVPTRKKKG